MKKYTILLFILTSTLLFSQTYSGPESTEYDYANSRWLIANTTSHQVLARNSAGVLSVFATGLVSGPYGIEIVGDVLYCCSGASIKGYSLATGLNVFNVNVGASFLNGLTHDNSGNLYATDFSAKKIFKVNTATQAFSAIASSLVQSPNGIVYDAANNRCVFVNWGANAPIKAIDLTSFTVTTILPTTLGSCDGITRDGNGNYYISTWGSQNVVKYDNAFANAPISVSTGLSNPADLFYNIVDNVLAIPNSGNNTVTFLNLALSISEYDNNWLKNSTVSPNPIIDQAVFNFELSTAMKVSAELVDIQGRIINTLLFPNNFTQQGHIEIPTNNLNKGVYFVNFKADNYSKSIPILFQGK